MRMLVRIAAVLVLLAWALVLGGPPMAQSGCVGPVIGIGAAPDPVASPTAVRVDRSTEVSVVGKWFFDGCSDVFVSGGGCSTNGGNPRPLATQTPMSGVELILAQGSRTWTLATADAGPEPDYIIGWQVRIPTDAADGPATLSAQQVELPIVITS